MPASEFRQLKTTGGPGRPFILRHKAVNGDRRENNGDNTIFPRHTIACVGHRVDKALDITSSLIINFFCFNVYINNDGINVKKW